VPYTELYGGKISDRVIPANSVLYSPVLSWIIAICLEILSELTFFSCGNPKSSLSEKITWKKFKSDEHHQKNVLSIKYNKNTN